MDKAERIKKLEGALIDMDGVLYDSMPGHTLAWKRMMNEVGVDCDRDEFYLYEGMTGAATIDLLFRKTFGHGCDAERARELYSVKSRYFKELGPAPVMPGADRMLAALHRLGMRRVLVTGSGQASLLEKLQLDYPGVFPEGRRVTAHDVTHGKPAPEPYLKGAELAGVPADRCLVVENAPLGVRAGKAAGCFTVAVTTGPIPREEFERENADMIFESMPAFADWLESLADGDDDRRAPWRRELDDAVERLAPDKVFLLTDDNVAALPHATGFEDFCHYVVPAGERSKNVDTLGDLWRWLGDNGATRASLLVNVGGGVVSDLGGFAAGTFKRGIRDINIPTTLLAMADAAIGGKTGIDFNGMKNEAGMFKMPENVIVDTGWLDTLPAAELANGFAEVVKSAMLGCRTDYEALLRLPEPPGCDSLRVAAERASRFKNRVVAMDAGDRGIRHILNFGHTAGHAFESLAAECRRPVSHGEAVAHGMLVALILSNRMQGLPESVTSDYARGILGRHYRPLPAGALDIKRLLSLMDGDKKNRRHGEIAFVLLRAVGDPVHGVVVSHRDIESALETYLELCRSIFGINAETR